MLNSKHSARSYNKCTVFENLVNNSDLPTAVKSNYQDYSPHGRNIGSPTLRSPSRYNAKIE